MERRKINYRAMERRDSNMLIEVKLTSILLARLKRIFALSALLELTETES